MICRTCLGRALPAVARTFTTGPIRSISTSLTRAVGAASPQASKTTDSKPSNAPLSSCPAGTVMVGLNYIKGRDDPVALPDEEYPAWLWTCLESNKAADDASSQDAGDEYSKSKKERRAALRRKRVEEQRILQSGDLSALEPKIPVTKQTINMPANEKNTAEGAIEAFEKREELRFAMRRDRKAKIKETNYLKSM
ncbi:hypothetical protein MKZ38_005658 [Zalerion maritima]|uniref:Large ribosomal subunit protein mL54 n=1 Tax=Zalerion maritima TaxID=339359 RepID=A0AAD5RW12_9PEZI|nr:hypothetical protein MKZ38_005658 [Zalerion maritima]